MSESRSSLKRTFSIQTICLLLLAVAIAIFWWKLQHAQQEEQYPVFTVAVFWILVLVFLLWAGNLAIHNLLRRIYSWEAAFNLRFVLQLFLTLIYSLLCINATYYTFKTTFTELPPDRNQLFLLNIYGILFLVPVVSVQFGLLFLQKWKKAIIEHEKLQQEQVQTELLALKSHLSPHFLFNNLNILSSLIQPENEEAQDFLDYFAEVYRYVLKNRERELVALQEEIHFLEAYSFLLIQRFGDSLSIRFDIDERVKNFLLPPLALQMLVENALKHNKLSEQQPLKIHIFSDTVPVIVIKNNLQLRTVNPEEQTGFGLENIRRRYWLLARKEIRVQEEEDFFLVELPLIEQR